MAHRIGAVVACAASVAVAQVDGARAPVPMRVMTFNIRYAEPKDGANRWELRRELVAGIVQSEGADLCGMQEALPAQVEWVTEHLPAYDLLACGRDGDGQGESCPILWLRERFVRRGGGTFWLSPTPEEVGPAWGATLNRICTWVELEERESKHGLFVFNTHFDHRSFEARVESAALLVEQIAKIAGDAPAVLLGDLNCAPDSPPYEILTRGGRDGVDLARALQDAHAVCAEPHFGPAGTFTGFGRGAELHDGLRIDYVFVKNAVRVVDHGVLASVFEGGRLPSDHRPVAARLLLGAAPARAVVDLRDAEWRPIAAPAEPNERTTATAQECEVRVPASLAGCALDLVLPAEAPFTASWNGSPLDPPNRVDGQLVRAGAVNRVVVSR